MKLSDEISTSTDDPLIRELTRLLKKKKFSTLPMVRIKTIHVEDRCVRVLLDTRTGRAAWGVARCSPKDAFSFSIGFSIAASRALEQLRPPVAKRALELNDIRSIFR